MKLHPKIALSLASTKGFTLIELLVAIIIVGILSAIAIPSFLNQANKARQAEPKLILSSLISAQQVYYLEHGRFADTDKTSGELGVGFKRETANYRYNFAPLDGGVIMTANPTVKNASYKAYAAGVGVIYQVGNADPLTLSVMCESTKIGQTLDAAAISITPGEAHIGGGEIECVGNAKEVRQ